MSYDQYQMQPEAPKGMGSTLTPFVRETYRLFLFGLLGMMGMGVFSYNFMPPLAGAIVQILAAILWVAVGWFRWRRPTKVVLPLFTIITGLWLGVLAQRYTAVLAPATILTLGAFGGLTAYAHITRKDFSFLKGFLAMSFWVLLLGIVTLILFPALSLFSLALSVFGTLVMGGWVLYDTSRLIRDNGERMTPGEAAAELLLDIVGLFQWILSLLDRFR
jgi:FtsH-binding integral membrane protein